MLPEADWLILCCPASPVTRGIANAAAFAAMPAGSHFINVARGEIAVERDVIAALKRCGLIDGAIRAPQPGAPFAYVTTGTFLEAFGFASLRDLPDLERLKAEGLMQTGQGDDDLDGALGLATAGDDEEVFGERA